ncbi:MAG TPA: SpoIIE family protein phosphatase [Thermoanaerobaculia bacterium]|nr:SpoIIE family protein phosphatase [Thermoanaerobaculia bacterium]
MKIRTALVLACFLLSVLPLGVIVIYSYYASRRALESAYHAEAARLTAQMDRRLGNIRDVLEQRLAEVSALPNLSNADKEKAPVVGNILMTMGDAASLVDSLEIRPIVRKVIAHSKIAMAAPMPHPNARASAAPAPPIVIDIPPAPKIPRFTFSEEQRSKLKQISDIGRELNARRSELTPEQREQLLQQLKNVQAQFEGSMKATQKQFDADLKAALKAREQQADQQREAAEEKAQADAEAAADRAEGAKAAQEETAAVRDEEQLSDQEKQHMKEREKQAALLFGKHFNVPVTQSGAVVGRLQAQVSTEEVIRRVLGAAREDREGTEITFAVDREGNVYTRTSDERRALDALGIPGRIAAGKPVNDIPNWIVVLHRDVDSGLRVGVARPFGEDLEGLRKTAAKNFGYGIALIFVALIGIVPIANHITGDVELVTRGAERIAHGDLTTRLPVQSKNEIGQLATAFNRMAEDLSLQQQRIVEQERAAIEYERKSAELEEARRFQLSMLPKKVPQLDGYDIAVFTHTATEVGGDYYDFHVDHDGVSVTVGDATGHGASAGTMVVVIKALFAGYSGDETPSQFLRDATEKVRRMDLGRMAMALLLARFEGQKVTVASAGMPPAYVHRRHSGAVEEVSLGATPLGTLGDDYRDARVDLAEGDTLLFMSDGFPELMNATGQQLGYAAATDAFAAAAKARDANAVIAALAETARSWHGEQPPNDDVTFVVVRARGADQSSSA